MDLDRHSELVRFICRYQRQGETSAPDIKGGGFGIDVVAVISVEGEIDGEYPRNEFIPFQGSVLVNELSRVEL